MERIIMKIVFCISFMFLFSSLSLAQTGNKPSDPTQPIEKNSPDKALIKDWKTEGATKEGVVKITGSDANVATTIFTGDEKEGASLCKGDLSRRLSKLSGMTVKISGVWQEPPTVKHKCLEAKEFEVTKAASGRIPLIGILKQKDGLYIIENEAGKTTSFNRIPKGLQDRVGQKVIVDVRPFPSGSSQKEDTYKVVSFADYP